MKKRKIIVVILVCALLVCALLVCVILRLFDTEKNLESPLEDELPLQSYDDPSDKTEIDNNEDNTSVDIDYSQLTYSALGDSITEAWQKKAYPVIVEEILGLKDGINYGIGGTTVSNFNNGFVNRYDKMSIDSDIISIQGGINDSRNVPLGTIDSFDESTFMGAYNSLIHKLKQRYPDSFIFLISMPKTYNSLTLDMYVKGNSYGFTYLDYAYAIYEIAEKWNLPVLDLYVDSFCEDTKLTDGCHPSQTYITETLAPMVANFIELNYPKYLEQQKAN